MALLQMPTKAQPREVVQDGDLIPDNRLTPGATDLLEHDAIGRGVAEIAWTAQAPVNIALFGAWGSGKSSVYSMIERHLARIAPKKVRVARYDAWKYGGRELKRNFIESLSRDLGLEKNTEFSDGLDTEQLETELRTGAWLKKNWLSLLIGLGLAVIVAVCWVVVQAVATVVFTDDQFKSTAKSLIAQAGTVFGLALIATLVGPKVFEGAVRTKKTPAPEGADQFASRFKQLVRTALKGKAERLVVFIDELDRCDPKDVVATLIDLKTFLDQDDCVFIVAADREVIERALTDLPQAKPVREEEPYYATPGAFLDKIFQHQLALPPLRPRALTQFAQDLLSSQGGVWQELRDQDETGHDTFDRTVFALVPVHVRSPRRVKVLLNNFATNARIAESRGIAWLDRTHELAVLTVLQTEFPSVAEDLRRVPRLLTYIRGEQEPSSPEAEDVVSKYLEPTKPPSNGEEEGEEEDAGETAAGRLLSDDTTREGTRERQGAGEQLRRHLTNYLAKVTAAGIRDPRPDLLYLQSAAGREDLPDPKLGDVIDFAADTAPDTVVAAFDGQASATLAVAIPLLVLEGDGAVGPGRAFAYESACRLIAGLDADERAEVTAKVAPSLKAAVTDASLPHPALPGALLVAAWDGDREVADTILRIGGRKGFPRDVLGELTAAMPYLEPDEWTFLVQLLAERFATYPEPLLTALRDEPYAKASKLWARVEDRVIGVLNKLELPPPPAAAAKPSTAAVPEPDEPEPTGDGVERLSSLVAIVRDRDDYEQLLSEVLSTFQSPSACEPLRDWVDQNADDLIGTMSSALRQAYHAFVALDRYPNVDAETWSALLPEYGAAHETSMDEDPAEAVDATEASESDQTADSSQFSAAEDTDVAEVDLCDVDSAVTESANRLLPKLLTQFATAAVEELPGLRGFTAKVASWSSTPEETLSATIADTLASIGWTGGSIDDAAGQLVWARKKGLLAAVEDFAEDDNSPLYKPFVDDLAEMLNHLPLTTYTTSNWRAICKTFPTPAAKALSVATDAYTPNEDEGGAVFGLRLAALAASGGPAPAACELLALPVDQVGRSLTDAWLKLDPEPADTHKVLTTLPFTTRVLGTFCDSISTPDRTAIWNALLASGSKAALEAVGARGVGDGAVDELRKRVAAKTRDSDRSRLVSRLMLATPDSRDVAAVKKSACQLAQDLLDTGTASDVRAAADLMLWAGGPVRGYTVPLRDKFNAGVARHEKALPQKVAVKLRDISLLTIPKKGFLSALWDK